MNLRPQILSGNIMEKDPWGKGRAGLGGEESNQQGHIFLPSHVMTAGVAERPSTGAEAEYQTRRGTPPLTRD